MPSPFIPSIISYFSPRLTLRQSPTLSSTINAALLLSLVTLTACGSGSDNTAADETTPPPVVVSSDTVSPIITLKGDKILKLSTGSTYAELGATATDDVDGSVNVTITGTVDSTVVNSYILTYTATDAAGNSSTLVRTVEVIELRAFITQWTTDNVGFSDDFTIHIGTDLSTHNGSYDYTVNWGDGKTTTETGDAIHTYDIIGTYNVSIKGSFPQTYFKGINDDSNKLVSVEQWGDNQWLSMYKAFFSCSNAIVNATDTPNLKAVTNMSEMFSNATEFNQNISAWDVSSVINMSYMFSGAISFNQDLNTWDVKSVDNMSYMFAGKGDSAFNGNISSWNVSSVTNMSGMFSGALSFNQDISAWNVSSVTNMSDMFIYAVVFNQDLSTWNVSSVTDMSNMFGGEGKPAFNSNISSWNVSSVTNMSSMFGGASVFNQDLSTWDVSSVTNMNSMFDQAIAFDQNISTWNVRSVTDMGHMFYQTTAFDQNISAWDVSSVTDMSSMFTGSPLNTLNFDALIQKWSLLELQSKVQFDGGDNASSFNSQVAFDILTKQYGWVIGYGSP